MASPEAERGCTAGLGILLLSAGIGLQFGLGPALIIAGFILFVVALADEMTSF